MEETDDGAGDLLEVYLNAVRSLMDSHVLDAIDEEITETQMEDHILTMTPLINKLQMLLEQLHSDMELCQVEQDEARDRLCEEAQSLQYELESLEQNQEELKRVLIEQENSSISISQQISTVQIHNFQATKRLAGLRASVYEEEKIKIEKEEIVVKGQALNEEHRNIARAETEMKAIEEQQITALKDLQTMLSGLRNECEGYESKLAVLKENQNKQMNQNSQTAQTISQASQTLKSLKKQNMALQEQRDKLSSQIELELNGNEYPEFEQQQEQLQLNNGFGLLINGKVSQARVGNSSKSTASFRHPGIQGVHHSKNVSLFNQNSSSQSVYSQILRGDNDGNGGGDSQSEMLSRRKSCHNRKKTNDIVGVSLSSKVIPKRNSNKAIPSSSLTQDHNDPLAAGNPELVLSLKEETGEIFNDAVFSPTSSTLEFLRRDRFNPEQQKKQLNPFPMFKSPVIAASNTLKQPTKRHSYCHSNSREDILTPLDQHHDEDSQEEEYDNSPLLQSRRRTPGQFNKKIDNTSDYDEGGYKQHYQINETFSKYLKKEHIQDAIQSQPSQIIQQKPLIQQDKQVDDEDQDVPNQLKLTDYFCSNEGVFENIMSSNDFFKQNQIFRSMRHSRNSTNTTNPSWASFGQHNYNNSNSCLNSLNSQHITLHNHNHVKDTQNGTLAINTNNMDGQESTNQQCSSDKNSAAGKNTKQIISQCQAKQLCSSILSRMPIRPIKAFPTKNS